MSSNYGACNKRGLVMVLDVTYGFGSQIVSRIISNDADSLLEYLRILWDRFDISQVLIDGAKHSS